MQSKSLQLLGHSIFTCMVAHEQVLNVDGQRNRATLTLKKSLIDTELPVLTKLEDAKIGLVTPGVVAKILPKSIIINYFGGLRGTVALREARYVLCLTWSFSP